MSNVVDKKDNQHYIPQFYQRYWDAGEKRVYRYNKKGDRLSLKPVSIRRNCSEHRLYEPNKNNPHYVFEDIYSKKRTANISNARKMCFYIIRNVTDMSFEAIGNEFNKDRTTVMYNIDEMEKKLSTNSMLNSQVLDIINNIKDEQ